MEFGDWLAAPEEDLPELDDVAQDLVPTTSDVMVEAMPLTDTREKGTQYLYTLQIRDPVMNGSAPPTQDTACQVMPEEERPKASWSATISLDWLGIWRPNTTASDPGVTCTYGTWGLVWT